MADKLQLLKHGDVTETFSKGSNTIAYKKKRGIYYQLKIFQFAMKYQIIEKWFPFICASYYTESKNYNKQFDILRFKSSS